MGISLFLKLFESIVFSAVIFVIWYIYHNAQVIHERLDTVIFEGRDFEKLIN